MTFIRFIVCLYCTLLPEIEMSDKADRATDYCGGHAERVLEFGVDFDSGLPSFEVYGMNPFWFCPAAASFIRDREERGQPCLQATTHRPSCNKGNVNSKPQVKFLICELTCYRLHCAINVNAAPSTER